ncbi:hypothetical protein D6783_04410 [Candidatus Woesearchaeota archaeon]|nr:MAG: hypothetical protein D6783_04410 [Candidatus Woesearchaeota archaeon]
MKHKTRRLTLSGTIRTFLLFTLLVATGFLTFREPTTLTTPCNNCTETSCLDTCTTTCHAKLYDHVKAELITNPAPEKATLPLQEQEPAATNTTCSCTCSSTLSKVRTALTSSEKQNLLNNEEHQTNE